jgi:hypothetical protein
MLHCVALVVPVRATWYNIPEDGILHSHDHENLKSYIISKRLTDEHTEDNASWAIP